jgi:hypothetical protein
MELRARIRPLSRRAAFLAALVALVASAVAGAVAPSAHAAKKKKAPAITRVAPLEVSVGETLTLRGRNFIAGRKKNTVVFKRRGARALFVKADLSTKKMLRVTVPATTQKLFRTKAGNPVPTRFRLRVLARKFGKRFTKKRRSPLIHGPGSHETADKGDCDKDGVVNKAEADDDNDLINDDVELAIGTNLCALDSDGDGVEDGFEWQSAKDLNDDEYQKPNQILPYPGKRPYPNPLFAADATLDFDGDSLSLTEEQTLWRYTFNVNHTAARTLEPLSYSDGMQASLYQRTGSNGRRVPAQPWSTYPRFRQFVDWAGSTGYLGVELFSSESFVGAVTSVNGYYDIRDTNLDGLKPDEEVAVADYDGNKLVSDDERDEDSDGLSNYAEIHGPMQPGYWAKCYGIEGEFPIPYTGTAFDDADSDGDGILDGADDQDHDDLPNLLEISRIRAAGGDTVADDREAKKDCKIAKPILDAIQPDKQLFRHETLYGQVNPFNPCLPFADARTCPRYSSLDGAGYAPFSLAPDWLALQ